MAVTRTRTMLSESFDNFVAPVVNKPVPNHLSETKIYAKVGQNAILQARPSVVHFSGFHVGNKITRILEKLVPGMFIEVLIEFTPDDWRYYYDCIRIHTKAEENLIVPIHAYPVMDTEGFPREVHFPSVPLGESVTHVVPLKCSIPVDFEFTLSYIQLHPSFTVSPMSGIVEGNSELEIKLMVSQFNMSPLVCSFTGTSEPGLAKRLKAKEWTKELPKAPTSEVLDPLLIDPLGRTRLKRLKTRPWTSGDKKTPELVKDGLRFPAVAVQMQKEVTGSSKQMKETKFEYEVHQNIQEERQNQLRWCVRLGEDPMSELSRKQILDSRVLADQEYKLKRGDPQVEKEFDRSCVGCELRRIHRQAGEVPSHEPRFDILVNDEWSNRHMVLQKFVQAARKVIVRLRAKKHLSSLGEFMTDWRKGKFSREHSSERLLNFVVFSCDYRERDDTYMQFFSANLSSISVSFIKQNDVDALGTVSVQPTTVKVKTHVPYYNLKDEIINLVSSLPLTSVQGPSHVGTIDTGEETKEDEVGGREETSHTRSPAISTPQDGLTTQEPEAVPLVVPAALFRPHSYHPMHIFNPAPGLQVFKPPLPYAEVDEDYHMCPLSRQRTAGTSAKHSRKFLERQDVIPGVMTWKRFPCQPLVSMAANPTLSTIWIPRCKELLPTDVPPLLTGLQDGDAMSEEEMDDEGADLGFKEIAVPTPEMVCAQFSTSESVLGEQDQVTSQLSDALLHSGATSKIQATSSVTATTSLVPREKREKELNEFLTQRQNRLGVRIQQRIQSINDAMTSSNLELK
ncbi:Cilia- and flagella-associated protein 221 [Acropora cervicornis]|uniref:Cilia- and flagella-associated protein 221 n=1 Tax=Acropora cervicornis TaxID=6130 RepID=A0AAD9V4S1_ACRCE|nr:Cilia- and flagella-associated protein 221 [Acropora cervicornis]